MSKKLTPAALEKLPTLCTGQCCSLKIESATRRVWLCRVEGGVTEETYDVTAGRWNISAGRCTNRAGL